MASARLATRIGSIPWRTSWRASVSPCEGSFSIKSTKWLAGTLFESGDVRQGLSFPERGEKAPA